MDWLIIPLFAALNRLRGSSPFKAIAYKIERGLPVSDLAFKYWEFFTDHPHIAKLTSSKLLAFIAMGITVWVFYGWMNGLNTAAGMAFWAQICGWGLYFSAFHGRWSLNESECKIIDRLVSGIEDTRIRGTVAMSIRGLAIFPLFIGFAFTMGDLWLSFYGLIGLLQGPVYGAMRWIPEKNAATFAEAIYGGIIGATIWWIL